MGLRRFCSRTWRIYSLSIEVEKMSKETRQDYSAILKDFPRENLLEEVFSNFQVCQELVSYVLNEVKKEQLRSSLIATPEIVERHLELLSNMGGGVLQGKLSGCLGTSSANSAAKCQIRYKMATRYKENTP